MIPNITAYHVNSKEKCQPFIDGVELVVSEDTHYLGTGMYFWDNPSNAKYWVEKKKKEGVKQILVAKCQLILESPVLDMTDKDVITRVEKFWRKYCNKIDEKRVNQHLGTILDILYDVFPEIYGKMKVAKAHGFYSNYHLHEFLDKLKKNFTFVDNSHKTIYCVRCISKVYEPELYFADPR